MPNGPGREVGCRRIPAARENFTNYSISGGTTGMSALRSAHARTLSRAGLLVRSRSRSVRATAEPESAGGAEHMHHATEVVHLLLLLRVQRAVELAEGLGAQSGQLRGILPNRVRSGSHIAAGTRGRHQRRLIGAQLLMQRLCRGPEIRH